MKKFSFNDKSFLFDMDGVLINSMEGHYLAWQKAATAYGFSIDREEVYLREGEKGTVSGRDFLIMNNRDSSPDAVAGLLAHKELVYSAMPPGKIYPHVEDILKLLKANGISMALVTGTSRAELDKTLPAYISTYFPVKITGDMVKHGKPHPEPYLMALEQLGISPEEAVVVENAPYGIKSAKTANIFTVALCTSLPEQHLSQSDMIFHTHQQLYIFLTSMLV
ncbi:MAG: HAD family phosphatase [Candidatus Auribacterota bacterium]|jgi:HAD superfamily hydrolase (TIGR01509 family)|nr:HAD family phosphatase [Candidatus Auribacterota bacterium]